MEPNIRKGISFDQIKRCSGCKIEKPRSDFAKSKSRKDGCQSVCKPCHNSRNKTYRAKNPEASRKATREWFARNPGYAQERAQMRRVRKYGLSVDTYDRMLAEQDGKCAICGEPGGRQLHIDHDHESGAVRGLLCGNCNHAIGKLGDDPELLRRAANYLEAQHGA